MNINGGIRKLFGANGTQTGGIQVGYADNVTPSTNNPNKKDSSFKIAHLLNGTAHVGQQPPTEVS